MDGEGRGGSKVMCLKEEAMHEMTIVALGFFGVALNRLGGDGAKSGIEVAHKEEVTVGVGS